MKVAGSRILLTGATGGIGQTLARDLHARGAQLILSARRSDVLSPLADSLNASMVIADMAVPDDVRRLAAEAVDVDILIVSAALPASGHLLELTPTQIDTMLEVNLRAPIALARELAPNMVKRGRGHIVLISSLSGKAAAPASSIYSAAKFGLRGFAHGAREDLRKSGVGVSVILPGFIRDAGMFADSGAKLPPGVGTSSPEDVAGAVVSAIERNRREVVVAPLPMRLGADIASVAPGLSAVFQRLMGGARVARKVAAGQIDKRPRA
jgi:short-subunit dehydrogenase